MRKRKISKHIYLNESEAAHLRSKAEMTCLSESALIRLLIKGFEPREKPDERFYKFMNELSAIGNNIHQLSVKANALGFIDAPMLKKESEECSAFRAKIEREFLVPVKDPKWQ